MLGIDVEIVAESQLSAIPSISSTSEKERERLRRTMKNQMENKVCCSICMEIVDLVRGIVISVNRGLLTEKFDGNAVF